jgi:hypothetical protein
MTQWTVDSTGDRLVTADEKEPVGRIRDRMRRDATRWAKQGLTFEGVNFERSDSGDHYVIKGDGYELHTPIPEGCPPLSDALHRASLNDWTES